MNAFATLDAVAEKPAASGIETAPSPQPHPTAAAKMQVHGLDLRYGLFQALKSIDLEFPAHQVTALIGPSGCGKSTLLKTLNRMNDLVPGCTITGAVELDGSDVYQEVPLNDLRRRVGMVFQQPNPFPMSIYDNVAFGPRTHGVKKRESLDALVEQSLRDAALWDEVKDRLHKSALGLGRPAAASLHCPRPGSKTRGLALRRVHQRLGPHLNR